MGKYGSFRELMKNESEGTDYRVRYRCGPSNLLIAAPHGGGIEPGTSEIAEAVAGTEHGFYSFDGLKPENNRHLHIPCARFDEPIGLQIAEKADTVITVHGCKDPGETVFLGGRDEALREESRPV